MDFERAVTLMRDEEDMQAASRVLREAWRRGNRELQDEAVDFLVSPERWREGCEPLVEIITGTLGTEVEPETVMPLMDYAKRMLDLNRDMYLEARVAEQESVINQEPTKWIRASAFPLAQRWLELWVELLKKLDEDWFAHMEHLNGSYQLSFIEKRELEGEPPPPRLVSKEVRWGSYFDARPDDEGLSTWVVIMDGVCVNAQVYEDGPVSCSICAPSLPTAQDWIDQFMTEDEPALDLDPEEEETEC